MCQTPRVTQHGVIYSELCTCGRHTITRSSSTNKGETRGLDQRPSHV